MAFRGRGWLVCGLLGVGSGGCERVETWFGEPQAEVQAPLRHDEDGVSFAYPGNWSLREEPGATAEIDLHTLVLASRGDALMLLQVFRPAVVIDLDEHLELTMRTLIADFAGRGGGVGEVVPGPVTTFERAWLGAPRQARRAAIHVVMPGEEADRAIELHAARLPACTVVVFTMVPEGGQAQAGAGFDLVLDTLAIAAD